MSEAPDEGVDLIKPREACGVFGVYLPGGPVAHLCYLGLYALQHRGQESAGIAVSDGTHITVVKDMGLVASAFDDRVLAGLEGDLAIGHTRYSTTGSSSWRAAQPFYRGLDGTEFALGHNGNLTNTAELATSSGMLDGVVTSDSDLVAELIAQRITATPQTTRARPARSGDRGAGTRAAQLARRIHVRGCRPRPPDRGSRSARHLAVVRRAP